MLQVVTLILWAIGRFFLYSSYFAIFGALFGFTNFGKMVAIDNTFNGLVGLLQLPFTYWALHGLGGNFTLINCLQVRHVISHLQFGAAGACKAIRCPSSVVRLLPGFLSFMLLLLLCL